MAIAIVGASAPFSIMRKVRESSSSHALHFDAFKRLCYVSGASLCLWLTYLITPGRTGRSSLAMVLGGLYNRTARHPSTPTAL